MNEPFFKEVASEYLTEEVVDFIRKQIHLYPDQEIVFGGRIHPEISSKISECVILTRGSQEKVSLASLQLTRYNAIIHIPPSFLTPAEEDMEVASLHTDEVGYLIIDNTAEKVNVVVPPHRSQEKLLDTKAILNSFEPGGTVSQVLPEFETRSPQISMVKKAVEAFNQESVLLCEAETGTGKSLAYGIVAAHWALLNKKKVVISTNTINLQEQLLYKDLPVIKECLRLEKGTTPEIILVKGKNNYLCRRKFEDFKKEFSDVLNLSPEDKTHLLHKDEILNWGEKTLIGDRNELSFIPGYELWDKLGCENDTCQRKHCRYENDCFQTKLKKNIAQADILVVNHHILCADLSIKKEAGAHSGLLPPYQRLIIDESHHLEDIATIYFGSQASTFEIKRTLGLIARVDHKKKILKKGLLNRILKELPLENPGKGQFREIFYQQINAFIEARILYEDHSPAFFEKIFSYFDQKDRDSFFRSEEESARKEYKHRFSQEELNSQRWKEQYHQPLEQVLKHLQGLIDMITNLINLLTPLPQPEESPPTYLIELKAYRDRLQVSLNTLQASMEFPDPNEVRWVQAIRNKNQVYFASHVSPLEVGDLLRENLFLPLKTVILTSATLATGTGEDPFHHIKKRLGIDSLGPEMLNEIRISNQFDYARNCRMIVPPDVPSVNDRDFIPTITHHLKDLLSILRGRMLWLFTSYTMMKSVYHRLADTARELGVELWIQGDEPRHELIRKIQEHRNGVILGVSSFWEGVDIKGENLSCLVMIKLPFAVPDEPVLEARLEQLEALGKNPFMDYSLPQAILRFKQGFGRLIRSPQDQGVFILFDNRIFTKNYGQHFIAALPHGVTPQIDEIGEKVGDIVG